jgi:hypothetical protein
LGCSGPVYGPVVVNTVMKLLGFIKGGNFWLADRLLISQEGRCSVDLLSTKRSDETYFLLQTELVCSFKSYGCNTHRSAGFFSEAGTVRTIATDRRTSGCVSWFRQVVESQASVLNEDGVAFYHIECDSRKGCKLS